MNTETVRRPSPAPRPICPTCKAYLMARGTVIAREIAERAHDGASADQLAGEFMAGLHRRHTAGLPIGVPA